jgi:hypothetical protein
MEDLTMDLRLHRLETFSAQGSDGQAYKVCGYERLVRDESLPGDPDRWESTGVTELRLEDGSPILVDRQGGMALQNGVVLTR